MKRTFIISLFVFSLFTAFGQHTDYQRKIEWQKNKRLQINEKTSVLVLQFETASYPDLESLLPYYYESQRVPENIEVQISLENQQFVELDESNILNSNALEKLSYEIKISTQILFQKKTPYYSLLFVPLRKNFATGKIEKLSNFSIRVKYLNSNRLAKQNLYPSYSVLKNGKWVKIKLSQDGVYKITNSELSGIGIANPQNVRVFGNGGAQLPFKNDGTSATDLIENPIVKLSDGILFYGKSPVSWKYENSTQFFKHQLHNYSEYAYYFVTSDYSSTFDNSIPVENSLTTPATFTLSNFDDYQYFEADSLNFILSGRQWFWRYFGSRNRQTYTFSFPNIVIGSQLQLRVAMLTRSRTYTSFDITAQNLDKTINFETADYDYDAPFGRYKAETYLFNATNATSIPVQLTYNKVINDSEAWLDYLVMNAKRNLVFTAPQMHFRFAESVGVGNVTEFTLSNVNQNVTVWDVTNPTRPREMKGNLSGSNLTIRFASDSLRQFVAFDKSEFLKPTFSGEDLGTVANQDLHGLPQTDMIIITNEIFKNYANELADIHRNNDNLRVTVVTPELIYNEFSSGAHDVSALRNFVKMFYDRATNESDMPKYVLLFGDGSYDNNAKTPENPCYIPTYQCFNGIGVSVSYTTDDFFGYLDDNEGVDGDSMKGKLDIGIGRFPVSDTLEARNMLNKIRNYINVSSQGDWRNLLCFISDDTDGGYGPGEMDHEKQAEKLATYVETNFPAYNIEKIYMDAYPQVSSSMGDSYPEVNQAFNNRVRKGALIVNYTGHGNEGQLAHEHIIGVNDINAWDNEPRLPIFVTATCEFGRWDDYDLAKHQERTSAGELVLLNPHGGAIAMFTTSRLVYIDGNDRITNAFYKHVFTQDENGNDLRLGDIICKTKNELNNESNKLNFCLLGDPALRLAYPTNRVVTDSINSQEIIYDAGNQPISQPDTIKGRQMVTVSGHIENRNQQILNTFDGTLFPAIFDKKKEITTLANDGPSGDNDNLFTFNVQNSMLYKGKASIVNGRFQFSFIVPKDIDYRLGFGKVTYYARSEATNSDASGYFKHFIIGSSDNTAGDDNQDPEIQLFMNDSTFVDGGMTNEHPIFLAYVSDENGISTVGNGIGHDISAILDNDNTKPLILNDYYEGDKDRYQSGRIAFPLNNLEEGEHTIQLKVWDVNNNSSAQELRFTVVKSSEIVIENLYNAPNPMTDFTEFYFRHNQTSVEIKIEVKIYNLLGMLVKTIKTSDYPREGLSHSVTWNGTSDLGQKLEQGVYIYHLKISHSGNSAEKSGKLILSK